jgi:hypothetical protein
LKPLRAALRREALPARRPHTRHTLPLLALLALLAMALAYAGVPLALRVERQRAARSAASRARVTEA